ncbi:MAG: hypothetical protein J5483_05410 [Lachnospiraceae bacterium]|nr:hypothetical protein [Lachnospiraceae bacterium]
MKYTKEERIDIGRQVYTREISEAEAQIKYDIGRTCVQKYVRLYRETNGIQPKAVGRPKAVQKEEAPDIEAYQSMSKEELINELIKAKANELRAKKGYEVKGDGANREFIPLNDRNSRS